MSYITFETVLRSLENSIRYISCNIFLAYSFFLCFCSLTFKLHLSLSHNALKVLSCPFICPLEGAQRATRVFWIDDENPHEYGLNVQTSYR